MTLRVRSNLSSLIVQRDFHAAATSLNRIVEKMTIGYKINDVKISTENTKIVALSTTQNVLAPEEEANITKIQNITSSLSEIKDADAVIEFSNNVQSQILRQAVASLLATTNQAPSIAMNLI